MRKEKQTTASKLDQPTVYLLLQGNQHDWGHERDIITAARQQGWRLIDLKLFDDGALPAGRPPQGVLTGHLPQFPLVLPLRKLGCPP